jgi:hypothetical protein
MSVDFTIDFGARLNARPSDFGRFRGDALDLIAGLRFRWQEDLLEVWPVDTGTSLQAWENYIDGMRWILRNDVEYAVYVHAAGDDQPIWEYLRAQAETYAADVVPELRQLLTRAQAEQPRRRQIGLFGALGPRRRTVNAVVDAAVFAARVAAFQQPGRGARQRLRERFPNEPIGRATTRRRDRTRAR